MARNVKRVEGVAHLVDVTRGADKRLNAMANVAQAFASKGWRPARKALKMVQAVPTIFPQFDHGVRVGGLPLARILTVHGPSNEGKSQWALGLIKSFLARDHFAALVDAEKSTPHDWCQRLMGPLADHPGFVATRTSNYEETDDAVRHFCTTVGEARAAGKVPKETSGLVVVDSIKKLIPNKLFKMLLRDADAKTAKNSKDVGVDGMSGRGGQYKAALNSQWLDELVDLLERTNCAMVLIAREYDDDQASARDRMFDNAWKVAGGKSLIFDASIAVRITRASWLTVGSEDKKHVVGERHKMLIHKTKVAGKEERDITAYFHTSNGVDMPEGFDTVRDLLELAVGFGMVQREGACITWRRRRFTGEARFVEKVTNDPALFAELDQQVRGGFVTPAPVEEELPEPTARKGRKGS